MAFIVEAPSPSNGRKLPMGSPRLSAAFFFGKDADLQTIIFANTPEACLAFERARKLRAAPKLSVCVSVFACVCVSVSCVVVFVRGCSSYIGFF